MVNRENYLLVKKYLEHNLNVKQNLPQTVRLARRDLYEFITWLDEKNISQAAAIRPTFIEYMTKAGSSYGTQEQRCFNARSFLSWLILYERMKINEAWIDMLRPRKVAGKLLSSRKIWTLENVRKITAIKPESNREIRDIAATAFLFLSGMRIGAFYTLPLSCVDIARRRVTQSPEFGVHTKFSKSAITYLLPIPDLLDIVGEFDALVRLSAGGSDCNWYPSLNAVTGTWKVKRNTTDRHQTYERGLRTLCGLAGVPYYSPHKLRHGHAVYGVKHARNLADLKALSQNLMHANVGITDGLYGKLPDDDLENIMGGFSE